MIPSGACRMKCLKYRDACQLSQEPLGDAEQVLVHDVQLALSPCGQHRSGHRDGYFHPCKSRTNSDD